MIHSGNPQSPECCIYGMPKCTFSEWGGEGGGFQTASFLIEKFAAYRFRERRKIKAPRPSIPRETAAGSGTIS